MKKLSHNYLLCFSILLSTYCTIIADTEINTITNQQLTVTSQDILDGTKDIVDADANLEELRALATEQVREIECILESLKATLQKSPIANKELIRQQINLLYELVQNISGERIQDFDEASLKDLLEINETLINHLVEHTDGDLGQLCSIGQAFKKQAMQPKRTFISTQELRERYNQLQTKIQTVMHRIENFDFDAQFDQAVETISDATDSAVDTITELAINNTPAIIIGSQLATFAGVCYFGGLKRAIAYTALPLYLLRAQSYKNVNKTLPSLNWLKSIVGSSEKAYSVSLCQGNDLSELNRWIAEQEAKHNILIKINKSDQNDFNALKDLSIGVNDGYIYKFSMQMLFYSQLAEDFGALMEFFDTNILGREIVKPKTQVINLSNETIAKLAQALKA
jgi:hypothetical protein